MTRLKSKKQQVKYRRVRFQRMPDFAYRILFIHLLKPFVWLYTKLRNKDYSGLIERRYLVDSLRRTTMYFQEKDTQKRDTLVVYYCFTYTALKVKYRYQKKVQTSDYENFRKNCVINTGLLFLGESHEKGFWYINLMMSFVPIPKYHATRRKVVIGMGVEGFVYWEFASYPHMMISGVTGSGKSICVFNLLSSLCQANYRIGVLDGKIVDYSKTKHLFYRYEPNTEENRQNCLKLIKDFETSMNNRYAKMQEKGINNYLDDDYEPEFLLIDENVIFAQSLENKERKMLDKVYGNIVLLGRAAGHYLIVTMQRPDTEFLPGILRSNMMFKLVLGSADTTTYSMLFDKLGNNLPPLEIGKGWYMQGTELKALAIPFVEEIVT